MLPIQYKKLLDENALCLNVPLERDGNYIYEATCVSPSHYATMLKCTFKLSSVRQGSSRDVNASLKGQKRCAFGEGNWSQSNSGYISWSGRNPAWCSYLFKKKGNALRPTAVLTTNPSAVTWIEFILHSIQVVANSYPNGSSLIYVEAAQSVPHVGQVKSKSLVLVHTKLPLQTRHWARGS